MRYDRLGRDVLLPARSHHAWKLLAHKYARTLRNSRRTAAAQRSAWEQACRKRWRALLLIIRAKLEAVESGITTLESEFLANIVLPDGGTVGQWLAPQIDAAYATVRLPPMPGPSVTLER